MIVLCDTSVWIHHFRHGDRMLAENLSDGQVLMHSFVLGELACGNLSNRTAILSHLHALPSAQQATNDEVLQLIETRRLSGRGLGWVDVHLLASALLSHCRISTLDRKLLEAATELRLNA